MNKIHEELLELNTNTRILISKWSALAIPVIMGISFFTLNQLTIQKTFPQVIQENWVHLGLTILWTQIILKLTQVIGITVYLETGLMDNHTYLFKCVDVLYRIINIIFYTLIAYVIFTIL